MREWTNLLWPVTPFGADKRPFGRPRQLIASTAVQWADDGQRAVPAAVALVYAEVRRTGLVTVDPDSFEFGYRIAVPQGGAEAAAAAVLIDGHLIQARRHGAAVAAHGWKDDAHALRQLADKPMPGVEAVAEAWTDREVRERGTARVVETAKDLASSSDSLARTCKLHGLQVPAGPGGMLDPGQSQHFYELLRYHRVGPGERERLEQTLALSAVHQALAVALLAGQHLDRYEWQASLDLDQVVRAVLWDALPTALPEAEPGAVTAR